MKYRKFGKSDWRISALGFGCMRFPTIKGSDAVDEKEAIRMLRFAIDNGVNYLDSAYDYHNGNSEVVVGKALRDGYRKKVKLATKSPMWNVNSAADYDRILNEQLKRLQTDYIDFYLFHSLSRERWEKVSKFNLFDKAHTAIREGKIGNIGFSFHDDYPVFKEIIDGYDKWALCQIQYNYKDTNDQAGTKGLKYAASKGLPVVVMEPLLGGKLSSPPQEVVEVFNSYEKKYTPTYWALQWLWNQPEVTVVLSGMSNLEQVKENINVANNSGINSFGAREQEIMELAIKKYMDSVPIPCTRCRYCEPCPSGVDIQWNFELYNSGTVPKDLDTSRRMYSQLDKTGAQLCTGCKQCEAKCPQNIKISELLPEVHKVLGKGEPFKKLR